MLLFGGVVEVNWHGTLRARVKHVMETEGKVSAIRYYREHGRDPKNYRKLKDSVIYVKRLAGDDVSRYH